MPELKPTGDLRDFANGYYIDNIGKIFIKTKSQFRWRDWIGGPSYYENSRPIFEKITIAAQSPDEFFYLRMWDYVEDNINLSPLGEDFRRDFDARVKSLIGRKL